MAPRPKPFVEELKFPYSPHREVGLDTSLCDDEIEISLEDDKVVLTPAVLSLTVLGVFGLEDEPEEPEEGEEACMLRYRLNTTNPKVKDYDPGLFVPVDGLMYEDGPHEFYHIDLEEHDEKYGYRAVLFQSVENYEAVSKQPDLAPHLFLSDREDEFNDHGPLSLTNQMLIKDRALADPRFGEQVIIEGATPGDISVGDIFEVAGGRSTLKVQVTSPRKPCWWLDKKNKTSRGMKGIKAYTASRGLAGWFTSVLVAGELHDGMELVRTHHPYPKWTLENISQAVYGGEGDPKALRRGAASWGRTRSQLQELLNMDCLAEEEWKWELEEIMEKMLEEEKSRSKSSTKNSTASAQSICDWLAGLAALTFLYNNMMELLSKTPALACGADMSCFPGYENKSET